MKKLISLLLLMTSVTVNAIEAPSDEELEADTVQEILDVGEEALVAVIEAEGLTINRYNRLVVLVETYQSIENEIAFRLGTLDRLHD